VIAPISLALFAIIETAMVFFAGQVLETGVQDSGRLIYTSSNVTEAQFRQDFCNRVGTLFPCPSLDLCLAVRRYAPGTASTSPIDRRRGNYVPNCHLEDRRTATPWFPCVLSLAIVRHRTGYNIANVGRGSTNSSRLLTATAGVSPPMTVKLMKLARGWLVALQRSAARLGREKRGNVAIEFAVIVR